MPQFTGYVSRTRIIHDKSLNVTIEAATESEACDKLAQLDRDDQLTWHALFDKPSSGAHIYYVVPKAEK